MKTFGPAHAIGTGSLLPTDLAIFENGKEIGRIYFMPLSFNINHPYNVTMNHKDCGFFKNINDAKNFVNTGFPAPKTFY
ncbi:hypothetical protein LGIDLPPJ_00032 [Klebsiella phage KP13-27]|nr:hypothetical protein LGIDLPPJ_00032 [Klebsiella phage KP13-27]